MLNKIGFFLVVASVTTAAAAEYELKWDDGTVAWQFGFMPGGSDYWCGNDFDVATLGASRVVSLRPSAARGDNGQWDGFRVALFSFGEVPGSILWPPSGVPKSVEPASGNSWTWVDVGVGWTLPGGVNSFLAAHECFYTYPDNDFYCLDGDGGFAGHSWEKLPGYSWTLMGNLGMGNLMLRAVVSDEVAVTPASLGRVKALYR